MEGVKDVYDDGGRDGTNIYYLMMCIRKTLDGIDMGSNVFNTKKIFILF